MTLDAIGEIEEQARQLRATGRVAPGLEDELDASFEAAAVASLATGEGRLAVGEGRLAAGEGRGRTGDPRPASRDPGGEGASPTAKLGELRDRASLLARRRLGPSARRLERRALVGLAKAGEAASTRAHAALDHAERIAAGSGFASRVLSTAHPGGAGASSSGTITPVIDGPLLDWVLESLVGAPTPEEAGPGRGVFLQVECGDGRVVEALAGRGHDARGADPRRPDRATGDSSIVAAGALEYLGATPSGTLAGLLITGVVDRMRPGAARALAHLAASRLEPGGVVVVVSSRPEVSVAIDPVAADLAGGRPLHPVTWCHLLARYGLSQLAVFEPDASEPDVFAVSARRPVVARRAGEDSR